MGPAMVKIERYVAATVPVLAERVRCILGGSGLISLPTESFYGLAAAPFDEQALARLWTVKGRSEGKPILVLIGERHQLAPFVQTIPRAAQALMDAFWPGPLTIVFPAAPGLPNAVTAGTGSVGSDALRTGTPVTGPAARAHLITSATGERCSGA